MRKDDLFNAMRDIDTQYIMSAAPGVRRASGFAASRIRVAAIAACMALIMISAAVILPFSRRSDPPPETQPPAVSDPIADSTTSPGSEITTEIITPETTLPPPPETTGIYIPPAHTDYNWYNEHDMPWAIADIIEITNESVILMQEFGDHRGTEKLFYKVKCKILYNNAFVDIKYFDKKEYNVEQPNGVSCFAMLEELYVSADSIEELARHDAVLFLVSRRKKDNRFYYTLPSGYRYDTEMRDWDYSKYLSQFLPINDGKLDSASGSFEIDSFTTLYEFNYQIRRLNSMRQCGMELQPYEEEFYTKELADGMTVDEIAAYFNSFIRAYEVMAEKTVEK